MSELEKAAGIIRNARHLTAFTGAGISVESGIPTFRGPDGIWSKYDPVYLDIDFYRQHAGRAWPVIKEMFYKDIGRAQPNPAHRVLAQWENQGLLKAIITQNIDRLHQKAGSRNVIEYHGNAEELVCMSCGRRFLVKDFLDNDQAPRCPVCGGLLKPDFVFFGEPIPAEAVQEALRHSVQSDVYLVIGTTGVIMPASLLPYEAKKNGALIIEINPEESEYTSRITDIHLKGKASETLQALHRLVNG